MAARSETVRWNIARGHGVFDPKETRRVDPAGLPALLQAIRQRHGLRATWVDSVPVSETSHGRILWEGAVQVFAVQHPEATRVYAWSDETAGGRRRFHTVLGVGPVDRAEMAVRAEALG